VLIIEEKLDFQKAKYLSVSYPLRTIQHAIESTSGKQVAVVHGAALSEETSAYLQSVKCVRPWAQIIEDGKAWDIVEIAGANSTLSMKSIRRVESFFQKHWSMGQNWLSRPKRSVLSVFQNAYVESRIKKEGAAVEFGKFMEAIFRYKITSPLVLHCDIGGASLSAALAAWLWYQNKNSGPLVYVGNYPASLFGKDFPHEKFKREYIQEELLVDSACEYFGYPRDVIKSTLGVFLKSRQVRPEANADGFTLGFCQQFINVMVSETAVAQELSGAPPAQRLAPLRFETSSGRIDVLSASEISPSDAGIRSAAATISVLAAEMRELRVFSNVIPAFDRRLETIKETLEKISTGSLDDGYVIQLGIQMATLESLIIASQNSLGDTSLAEGTTFIKVLDGFLSQFSRWTEYSLNTKAREQHSSSAHSAASDLLANAASDSLATTPNLRARVNRYLSSPQATDESKLAREGKISTAENLLSTAISSLATDGKKEGILLASEVKSKLRQTGSSAVAKFISDNLGVIAVLAKEKGFEWLHFIWKMISEK
jgi:hypothetical protein